MMMPHKVSFYSTDIFENAGFKGQAAVYCTIILGVVQLVMTFVCMVIVDKAGRKILLLIGMAGMCVSSFGLALFITLGQAVRFFSISQNCSKLFENFSFQNTESKALSYMTVLLAITYCIFFSIGPGKTQFKMFSVQLTTIN